MSQPAALRNNKQHFNPVFDVILDRNYSEKSTAKVRGSTERTVERTVRGRPRRRKGNMVCDLSQQEAGHPSKIDHTPADNGGCATKN